MLELRDLLGADGLALRAVHLPAPRSPIRWVATSELVDPTPFLEGGEVLLTTGLDTADWSGEWYSFVERLVVAGVVAVGLAVELTHRRPPEDLVAACRRHRLNLFEVPRETTFVSVSRTAARMLERAERSAMQERLAVQRRLTEAALQPDDQVALLTILASTGGATCVLTAEGAVEKGPCGDRPELLVREEVAAEVRRMRPRGLRAAASVDTSGGTLLVHPLGLRDRPPSYLVAAFPGRPTALQRASTATAVALLSMGVEQRHERLTDDRRVRRRAVEMLVEDDARTAAVLLSARPIRGRTRLPQRATVLRARGSAAAREDALAAIEHRHPLSGILDGELVVVARPPAAAELAAVLVELGLRVGTGETVPTTSGPTSGPTSGLSASFRTAGHALAAATERTPAVSWQTAMGRGVLSLMDRQRADDFAASLLGDLRRDTVLLETLRAFLLHHGSQLQVAEDLGVHRNTVRHRVRRIETALGASLQDPQTRVDTWVALQALTRQEPERQ